MIGKEYFVRQAAVLFGMAKATMDPKISAALLDKAADLKSQLEMSRSWTAVHAHRTCSQKNEVRPRPLPSHPPAGAVSLRKRKPGFWPGDSKTFGT